MPLGGGSVGVGGAELTGSPVEDGVDWQVQRADGATDISAHCVIRTTDGPLVEVQSARGEPTARDEYFFRRLMRFTTGHPAWLHLNKVIALAVGQRGQQRVLLDVWRLG